MFMPRFRRRGYLKGGIQLQPAVLGTTPGLSAQGSILVGSTPRARQCQGEIQPMLLALQTSRGALFAISSQATLLLWAWKEPLRVEGTKGDYP